MDIVEEIKRIISEKPDGFDFDRFCKKHGVMNALIAIEQAYFEFKTAPKNDKNYSGAYENIIFGSHLVFKWLFQYCRDNCFDNCKKVFNDEIYIKFQDLFLIGTKFYSANDFMTLLNKRKIIAESGLSKELILRHKDKSMSSALAANALMHKGIGIDTYDYKRLPDEDYEKLVKQVSQNAIIIGNQIIYDLDMFASKLSGNVEFQDNLYSKAWHYPDNVHVGNFTFADLRKITAALKVFGEFHQFVCLFQKNKYNSIVVKDFESWIVFINILTKMESNKIRQIINLLIFDPVISLNMKKNIENRLHVAYQPFFEINKFEIALSNSLFNYINFEDTFYSLLNVTDEQKIGKLKVSKVREQYWLDDLKPFLAGVNLKFGETFGIKIKPNFSNSKKKEGEIDLVIFDAKDKFMLICELKWLINPVLVVNTINAIDDLQVACKQIKDNFNLAISNEFKDIFKQDLINKNVLETPDEFEAIEKQLIVISKHYIGTGLSKCGKIPIINEDLLKWILGEPKNLSLRNLWEIAKNRSYFPKVNVHYKNKDMIIKIKDYTIKAEKLGRDITGMKAWDPVEDIILPTDSALNNN